MHLIVGLGNPGDRYRFNRHNVGFMSIDDLASTYNLSEESSSKFNSVLYKGSIGQHKVMAIKPSTFMNDSGKAVSAFVNFFKIPVENVIVLHDEIDLSLGKIKVGVSGGTAGHNGLKSINSMVSNKYTKVRIGVGHPSNRDLVPKYVLENFKKDEQIEVDITIKKISDLFEHLLDREFDLFSSKINQR